MKTTLQHYSASIAILVFLASLLLAFGCGNKASVDDRCVDHVWRMARVTLMYADENDDTLPDAAVWMDKLVGLDKEVDPMLHDPTLQPATDFGYAFREKASMLRSKSIDKPEGYELIFDSTLPGRNAHGELTSLPSPGRHDGANNIGFLDGKVKHLEKR